jgi:hypothetical protein
MTSFASFHTKNGKRNKIKRVLVQSSSSSETSPIISPRSNSKFSMSDKVSESLSTDNTPFHHLMMSNYLQNHWGINQYLFSKPPLLSMNICIKSCEFLSSRLLRYRIASNIAYFLLIVWLCIMFIHVRYNYAYEVSVEPLSVSYEAESVITSYSIAEQSSIQLYKMNEVKSKCIYTYHYLPTHVAINSMLEEIMGSENIGKSYYVTVKDPTCSSYDYGTNASVLYYYVQEDTWKLDWKILGISNQSPMYFLVLCTLVISPLLFLTVLAIATPPRAFLAALLYQIKVIRQKPHVDEDYLFQLQCSWWLSMSMFTIIPWTTCWPIMKQDKIVYMIIHSIYSIKVIYTMVYSSNRIKSLWYQIPLQYVFLIPLVCWSYGYLINYLCILLPFLLIISFLIRNI